jgi:hypothetical protein
MPVIQKYKQSRVPVWMVAHKVVASQRSKMVRPVQGSGHPEHADFPVSFQDFADRLKGTDDEVWTKHLRSQFGTLKFTFPAWRATLKAVKES